MRILGKRRVGTHRTVARIIKLEVYLLVAYIMRYVGYCIIHLLEGDWIKKQGLDSKLLFILHLGMCA